MQGLRRIFAVHSAGLLRRFEMKVFLAFVLREESPHLFPDQDLLLGGDPG